MIEFFKTKDRLLYEKGYITEEEYLTRRADGRFSKTIVVAAVIAVTLYMLVLIQFTYLNISNHTSVFPPVEVTTGYFAFWTVEIIMLATLKRSKIKNKYEKEGGESSNEIQRNQVKGSEQTVASRGKGTEMGS